MSIKVIGIQDLNRRLKEVSKFITKTEKRKVTFGAAKPLVSAGRRITPKREHPDKHRHPFQNPRYYKKKIQAYYIPGNLKKSFARVAQKRLKRTTDTFVGANFARIKQLIYGTTVPRSDGYYAHMAFGKDSNARKYREKVIMPTIAKAGRQSLRAMEIATVKVWAKAKTRLKFK